MFSFDNANQELKNADVENKGLTQSVLRPQLKWHP